MLRVYVVRRRNGLSTGTKGRKNGLLLRIAVAALGTGQVEQEVLRNGAAPARCESVVREPGRFAAAPCGAARLGPLPTAQVARHWCGGMRRSRQ